MDVARRRLLPRLVRALHTAEHPPSPPPPPSTALVAIQRKTLAQAHARDVHSRSLPASSSQASSSSSDTALGPDASADGHLSAAPGSSVHLSDSSTLPEPSSYEHVHDVSLEPESGHEHPPEPLAGLPVPHSATQAPVARYAAKPPFDTHRFVRALEHSFPTRTAEGFMHTTRALLAERLGAVRREALTHQDLDNQAYLFRAALSEMRTEASVRGRAESAAVRAQAGALRREADGLTGRMNEAIATLRHEIQMDVDSRKNERANESKERDLMLEETLNKSLVELYDLRSVMEEVRWENMRKSVAALSAFLVAMVIAMELRPRPPHSSPAAHPPPAAPAPRVPQSQVEGLDKMDSIT